MRDERPPVEWLIEDPSPEHADLPGAWWLTPRPRHRAIAALVFAAVAGTAVYLLVASDPSAAPRAASTVPAAASPTMGITAIDDTLGPPNALARDPAHCPDHVVCMSTASVPAATSDAVRSYLFGERERSRVSVVEVGTQALYYRSVEVSAGNVQLLVIVSRPEPDLETPILQADETAAESIGYARLVVGGYVVQVQFTGPPGYRPSLEAARQLALDPRLRASG